MRTTSGARLTDAELEDGAHHALTLPRNADGTLSDESLHILNELERGHWQRLLDEAERLGPIGAVPEQKRERDALKTALRRGERNAITKETTLPELRNLLAAPKFPMDLRVTSHIPLHGITLTVTHTEEDVNLAPRLDMLTVAIGRIRRAGFDLPPQIEVHLPKWGRKIDVASLCASEPSPRAIFHPPNFVHLSPALVGNPTATPSVVNPAHYKFLSTELDPRGAATVVHEVGHMLHYRASPSTFYILGYSSVGEAQHAAMRVSDYATNNPREFVAEVFAGLVYGMTFDEEILTIYAAFGGPMCPAVARAIDRARVKAGPAGLSFERKPR